MKGQASSYSPERSPPQYCESAAGGDESEAMYFPDVFAHEEDTDVVFHGFTPSGIGCAFPAIAGSIEPSQLEESRWARIAAGNCKLASGSVTASLGVLPVSANG